MFPLLLSVAVISLSGVMLPGPMFAVTVAKSYRTPWAGVRLAMGHAVIELPLILLLYFGLDRVFQNDTVQLVLSLLGGGMIIWLGVTMFRARTAVIRKGKDLPYNAFIAGMLTSGLNPAFFLWWAAVGLLLIARFQEFGVAGLVALILAHWFCDLAWLGTVSLIITRTQKLWGIRVQEGIFIGCSLLLVGFGGWFLFSGIRMIV